MKQSLDDLALFGGSPEFTEPLHVGRPNIPKRDRLLERIGDVLDRRWLTNDGPLVREFEQRVAEFSGAEHCVAMANGTLGLEIASRALELDGEVIVPAFTFVATAHALRWQKIRPVFSEIDRATHLLDPEQIESQITAETSAILPVHLWGAACRVDDILAIARRHNLRLLFDGSHAFHSTYKGQPLGGLGDATVFSFHATKFINCFEGGAVTTNSADLADRMRSLRNFGFSGYDQVDYLGINGKMSEASAAMGLGCLESLDDFVAINRRNYETYSERLAAESSLRLIAPPVRERSNFQYIVGIVTPTENGMDRDLLVELLWSENIRARRYFYPGCHRMEPYTSETTIPTLPVTDEVCAQVIEFPTGTALSVSEIERICSLVRFAIASGAEIRSRLASV